LDFNKNLVLNYVLLACELIVFLVCLFLLFFLLFKFNYIIEVYLQFSHDFLLICASHEHVYLREI